MQNGERIWKWACRACAVGGFVSMLAVDGLDAPTTFYALLAALFFGPDVISGRLKLKVEQTDKDEP